MALRKIHYIITVITITLVCTLVVMINHHNAKKLLPPDTVPVVTLANLKSQLIPKTVSSYGTTVSPDSAAVAAQTSGVVTQINFNPGDLVKKGQLLFVLQSSDTSNQIPVLKAQMLASKDLYDRSVDANKNYSGTVSIDQIEQQKLTYEQNLASYNESLTASHIVSPIDGVASDTSLTVGSSVTLGAVLVQIVDPKSLQVKYSLPSQYAGIVQNGQQVSFYPNDSTHAYTGTVAYVSPLLNSSDFTLTLRANLNNDATLRPYLFGRVVQVIDPNYHTLVIPQNLVQTDASGFYVYIVDNNKVAKHYFTPVGVDKQGIIEVRDGLTDSTKIIVSDYTSLSPGLTVKVKNS